MEMPMDILNKRLGDIRDNGDIDFDNTAAALDIDMELQSKFLFFPIEELEADGAAIEDDRGVLHAGDGPEHCQARPGENPNWLLNHARNAMTLYWHLRQIEEAERMERNRQVIMARRPEPGIYSLNTGRADPYLVAVTAERRIIDLNRTGKHTDFTDTFDGLENPAKWTFTLIETGLGA